MATNFLKSPMRTISAPQLTAGRDSRIGIALDDAALLDRVVFTDAMKQATRWTSDRALALAGDGNVTSLASNQVADTVVFASAAYPSGDYTLLYDGRGTLAVDQRSGTMTAASGGRAIIHVVARPGYGIHLRLVATDPRNYMRNIRLILPGFAASYQSQPFYCAYLAHLAPFNVLRFGQWAALGSDALGYQILLANAVGADPWFTIPAGATDIDVARMAAVVHARLDPRLRPMFEYGEGVWRPGSPTNVFVATAGRNARLASNAQSAAVAWYALRSLQVYDRVQTAFGADSGRLVRVLSGVLVADRPAESLDRAILATANAGRRADVFAVDAKIASPASIAFTRSLVARSGLALVASGGPAAGDGNSARSTVSDLASWHAAGGGLFVASSTSGVLATSALLARMSIQSKLQLDAVRDNALSAYMRVYPSAHIVPLALGHATVCAPDVSADSLGSARAPVATRNVAQAALHVALDAGSNSAVGQFAKDGDFRGGRFSHGTTATIDTSKARSPAPMAVYQTARFGQHFSYTFWGLASSAPYTIRLHFAEYVHTAPRQRAFNVAVNGLRALSDFDIFSRAGGAEIATIVELSASASSAGSIALNFDATTDNALICGIEIIGDNTTPAPGPTGTPTASPTPTASSTPTASPTTSASPRPAPSSSPTPAPANTPPIVSWSSRPVVNPHLSSQVSGFSYEKKNLWYQSFMTASNARLIALFNNLGPTIIRIGGNSTERLKNASGVYVPTMWKQNGAGATVNEIAPSDYVKLAGFLAAANAKAIIAIPSHNGSTTAQMAAEAQSAASALGPHLYGFEIGNEVDLNCNGSQSCMLQEQLATINAIQGVLPNAVIVGPDAGSVSSGGFGYIMNNIGSSYDLVTAHYYIGASSSSPTISAMLGSDPSSFISTLHTAVSTHNGLGARADEAGSYYGGGFAGTSDTAAAGLFVLDFNFKAAIGGIGVNWQGGNDTPGSYTPISDTGALNSAPPYNIASINGEYYGMFAFAQVAAPGGELSTRNWSGNSRFSTYLVNEPDGSAWLVLNNKSSTAYSQSYDVGTPIVSAAQYVYTSRNPSDVTGMTYGGAPVTISGTWAGSPSGVLGYSGTVVSVNAAPYAATFVKLTTTAAAVRAGARH